MSVKFNILTIFPGEVRAYTEIGMLRKAATGGLAEYNIIDIRDFAPEPHKKVDDIPYGGGPGMVITVDTVVRALESLENPGLKILLSPAGKKYSQEDAARISRLESITLICGRYMGIDHRIREFIDEVVSVGDYILSGGELPALTIIESATRLIPGVLGDARSLKEDKGYPIYTRPRVFRGLEVPEVLLSGDHEKIKKFREGEAAYGKNDR
ncbi:MAG: tRNA (guanosine(37)-N1)-methyltransferase TrmD [Elusimicrobia bacterium]|nr:tRNA (guanosine(37)-N1)-methyltransferase TrmD [Elusimicrobiota bacterium]